MELTKLSRGVLYAIYFLVVVGLAVVIAVSFHSSPKKPNPPKPLTHQIAKPSSGSNQTPSGGNKSSGSSSSTSQPGNLSNTGPGDSALVGFVIAAPVGYYAHRRFKLRKS